MWGNYINKEILTTDTVCLELQWELKRRRGRKDLKKKNKKNTFMSFEISTERLQVLKTSYKTVNALVRQLIKIW